MVIQFPVKLDNYDGLASFVGQHTSRIGEAFSRAIKDGKCVDDDPASKFVDGYLATDGSYRDDRFRTAASALASRFTEKYGTDFKLQLIENTGFPEDSTGRKLGRLIANQARSFIANGVGPADLRDFYGDVVQGAASLSEEDLSQGMYLISSIGQEASNASGESFSPQNEPLLD